MNLIKHIAHWRKYELPSLHRSIPLATAYACMSCHTIQDGAKHGACYTCGSKNVRSVSQAFDWMTNEIHKRLEEAKERKRGNPAKALAWRSARDAVSQVEEQARRSARQTLTQEPQSLTEFRR